MPSSSKEKQKEYDNKRAGQRTRNWAVILYPDDLPENWKSLIDERLVKWIEGPVHNQDLNPDGTPKKEHVHTLFMFENVKSQQQIIDFFKDLFGESESGSIVGVAMPQQASDRCAVVRYMAHLDHPSKVQYDVAEIIGHNGADPSEILRYSLTETIDMMISIEEFIEKNNITELCDLSALIRYGHPEWYHIITTKNTLYFNAFIRSHRHKKLFEAQSQSVIQEHNIDLETGEILD